MRVKKAAADNNNKKRTTYIYIVKNKKYTCNIQKVVAKRRSHCVTTEQCYCLNYHF